LASDVLFGFCWGNKHAGLGMGRSAGCGIPAVVVFCFLFGFMLGATRFVARADCAILQTRTGRTTGGFAAGRCGCRVFTRVEIMGLNDICISACAACMYE
jgi:hypothetical protein